MRSRRQPSPAPPTVSAPRALLEEVTRDGAIFVRLHGSSDGPEFWEVVEACDGEITLARIECELAGTMVLASARATIVPVPGAFVGPLCVTCRSVESARVHLEPGGHEFVRGERAERRARLRSIDGLPTAVGDGAALTFLGAGRQWARESGRAA